MEDIADLQEDLARAFEDSRRYANQVKVISMHISQQRIKIYK
jgi:hypothetical protein